MRRKPVAIIAGVLAWLMLCGTALAASVDIDDSNKSVYANGNAITIKADDADPAKTIVTADDPTVTVDSNKNITNYTIYGGWKDANDTAGGTSITIEGGTVNDVYGGGHATATNNQTSNANVTGDTSIVVNGGTVTGDIFGGGDADSTAGGSGLQFNNEAKAYANVTGSTSIEINGGTVEGSIHGGGDADATDKSVRGTASAQANVTGSTSIVVSGGEVGGSVYGGGDKETTNDILGNASAQADVGSTDIDITGSTVGGDVYGGSRDGGISGSTDVDISDSSVGGSVYGGSEKGTVTGSTAVIVKDDSTVSGNVYGGGRNGNVGGSTSVGITDSTVNGDVYGGSRDGDVGGNTDVAITGSSVTGNVYGGGQGVLLNPSDIGGTTNVTVINSTVGEIYGGGDRSNASGTSVTMGGTTAATAIYAGSRNSGWSSSASIVITGGTLSTGNVYGWGREHDCRANITTISVSSLTARNFTFWLHRDLNPIPAIPLSGNLQWDSVARTDADPIKDLFRLLLPYRLTQPAPRTVTVTFYYKVGGTTVHTEVHPLTVAPGESQTATPMWDGDGYYDITGNTEPVTVDFGSANQTRDIAVTPKTDTVTVTFIFKNGTSEVSRQQVESEVLSVNKLSSTVRGSRTEDEHYEAAESDVDVQFGQADFEKEVQLTPKTDTVTVTFIFKNGTSEVSRQQVESEVLSVNKLSSTVRGSRVEDEHYEAAESNVDVQFGQADFEKEVQLTPKTRTVTVVFNYLYRGNVVHSESIPVDVTYGEAPRDIYPTAWDGDGRYIVPSEIDPASVDFLYNGDQMVIQIDVRRVARDDDDDELPLGPGTTEEGAQGIPLGVPRTDNTSSASLLLTILAFACLAMIAALRKANKE